MSISKLIRTLEHCNRFSWYHNSPNVAYMTDDPCTYCGGPADTWDHLTPRAEFRQGLRPRATRDEWKRNKARACGSCNSEKGAAPVVLYLLYRRTGNVDLIGPYQQGFTSREARDRHLLRMKRTGVLGQIVKLYLRRLAGT